MAASCLRPLLILDLDETLIYGSEARLHRPADFRVGPFHVYQRPGLEPFLAAVTQHYDVAIWSSASADYVAGIAAALARFVPQWKFIWARDRCTERLHPETLETCFLKDLRKVKRSGINLDRVLIVDDTPSKVSRNYGNAIYICAFTGSDDDHELPQLANYLDSLYTTANFRKIEKRNWRTRANSA